ncbi:hypothetical protein [Chitinilyticum piscinae]|uniref:Uncharacterized protein n=1 Tax=Chitinilyticum piscinae TaxID=2866724 RepID=A0A8J7FIL1_9NEIS|nr:hypothetical protein [Chitinilyticum piscinae]MBE9608850.1 hypothetical protein [Chitinilyticum piscinae]
MDLTKLTLILALLLIVLLLALLMLIRRRRPAAEEIFTCVATMPGDLPSHRRKGRRQVLRSPYAMPREEFLASLPWLLGLSMLFITLFACSLFAI